VSGAEEEEKESYLAKVGGEGWEVEEVHSE
jgi:hypothetical protein